MISKNTFSKISIELLRRAVEDEIERKIVKLLIKKGDTILMLKRASNDSFPDLYELPGGELEENEDIFTGGSRELYEETNLSIQELLLEPEIIDFISKSNNKKCRVYVLKISIENEDIKLNPKEHSEYRWILSPEIDNLFIFPEIKKLLRENF